MDLPKIPVDAKQAQENLKQKHLDDIISKYKLLLSSGDWDIRIPKGNIKDIEEGKIPEYTVFVDTYMNGNPRIQYAVVQDKQGDGKRVILTFVNSYGHKIEIEEGTVRYVPSYEIKTITGISNSKPDSENPEIQKHIEDAIKSLESFVDERLPEQNGVEVHKD